MHRHAAGTPAEADFLRRQNATVGVLTAAAIENQAFLVGLRIEQGAQEHFLAMLEMNRKRLARLDIAGQQESHRLGAADPETGIDFRIAHLVELAHSNSSTRSSEAVSSAPQPCAINTFNC